MHTLFVIKQEEYRENIEKIVSHAAGKYEKVCYISFNDPYHVVIEMLRNFKGHEKFIVIDASGDFKEKQELDRTTYVLPITHLFDVYLFLRNLIKQEGIELLLLDSLSALIYKHNQLPLKEMMTNLLLEVGTLRCGSSIVVFKGDIGHEVVTHLNPFFGQSFIL